MFVDRTLKDVYDRLSNMSDKRLVYTVYEKDR